MTSISTLPQSFLAKKERILRSLAVPTESYDDLSPKGSVDEGIRELIDEINLLDACVTTSSCAGRISIFLEGRRSTTDEEDAFSKNENGGAEPGKETTAGVGGKGGGGRWLFVSHDRVSLEHDHHGEDLAGNLGMERDAMVKEHIAGASARYIHFKFEPMILHVLTASLEQAQIVLSAALQAGFRESGAINLIASGKEPAMPMVAVRSMGLALESLVGRHSHGRELCAVSPSELRSLVEISNERFGENEKRIRRFRELLLLKSGGQGANAGSRKGRDGEEWEDAAARRERKKAEGLLKKQQLENANGSTSGDIEVLSGLGFLEQNT